MRTSHLAARVLPAAALLAAACGAAPFVRVGSGPLNASVQNERDAAIDRAVAWLVSTQSPEGDWGGSNVVATAAAALAVRGDREEMPEADAQAVERAVKWLQSPACGTAADSHSDTLQGIRLQRRDMEWRRLALSALRPKPASGNVAVMAKSSPLGPFDMILSADLAECLSRQLDGELVGAPPTPRYADLPNRFISATFAKTPPDEVLRPLVEGLAKAWNDGTIAPVWLGNPEAGWWLARAINGATGGNLSLPPDADGRIRNVNWRGFMAGKWINSQRIDNAGNGHWDGDAEKTAFAVLLLNEL